MPATRKTSKRTATAKASSRSIDRAKTNGVGPIRSKARREKIEALIERTTKGPGFSPEEEAAFKDDAWGKRHEP